MQGIRPLQDIRHYLKSLSEKLLTGCKQLWNMYGPTETTIWSTIKQIHKAEEASNIGKPIHNTSLFILDEAQQLLPIGGIGNIYISGDGLAKGYYKSEELTGQKFTQNHFLRDGELMYETGDLGKWNENGEVEFLGRNDFQVKVRGYRIELGDIESKLNTLQNVRSSVVIARKSKNQEAVLIAYLILSSQKLETSKILSGLRKELPEYMIPSHFVPLKEFPLTLNNKIDRKALASMEITVPRKEKALKNIRTGLQEKLLQYFKESLEHKGEIGLNESFFELGGHSLNAVKLIFKIEKQLHFQLTLREVFDNPSIEALSRYLSTQKLKKSFPLKKTTSKPNYPLTPAQEQIWLASQDIKKSIAYNMSAVYSIDGTIDHEILKSSFLQLIRKHASLRTSFTESAGMPYQRIRPYDSVNFDMDHMKITAQSKNKVIEDYVNQEFDLENELLLRVAIAEITGEKNLLIFNTHHLIMDGWSLKVLIEEVIDNYQALMTGREVNSIQPEIEFKDYIAWQEKLIAANKQKNSAFWSTYLEDYKWKKLSLGKFDSSETKNQAGIYEFHWDHDFLTLINQTAREYNVSLNSFLTTTLSLTFCKILNCKDFCMGIVNSGRTSRHLQNLIGMFVKTLPFRFRFEPNSTISDCLKNGHKDLIKIDTYQDLPDDIQQTLRLEALFVLQTKDFNYDLIEVGESLQLGLHPGFERHCRLPLIINLLHNGNSISGRVVFDTNLFDRESIAIVMLRYESILKKIVTKSDSSIESIAFEPDFSIGNTAKIDFAF